MKVSQDGLPMLIELENTFFRVGSRSKRETKAKGRKTISLIVVLSRIIDNKGLRCSVNKVESLQGTDVYSILPLHPNADLEKFVNRTTIDYFKSLKELKIDYFSL